MKAFEKKWPSYFRVNTGLISDGMHGYNVRVIHANASNNALGNILIYITSDFYYSIIFKTITYREHVTKLRQI